MRNKLRNVLVACVVMTLALLGPLSPVAHAEIIQMNGTRSPAKGVQATLKGSTLSTRAHLHVAVGQTCGAVDLSGTSPTMGQTATTPFT